MKAIGDLIDEFGFLQRQPFPAPFGPSNATYLPSSMGKAEIVDGFNLLKRFADAFDFDYRRFAHWIGKYS